MSLKTSHLKAILLLIFIALIVCWDLVLFDLVANVFGDFVMGKRFLLVTVGLLVNLALILTGLSLGRGLQQRTQSDQDSELTQKESSKADQFSHSSPLIAFLAVGVVFPALVIFTAFCFYAAMFSFQRGPISFRIGIKGIATVVGLLTGIASCYCGWQIVRRLIAWIKQLIRPN